MKEKRGISLVALIITIIVLIILTGTVILTMNNGNTIGKSKEAVFKSDLSNYREEVSRNILNEQVKGNIASMKDVTVMPSDENYETEIKKYIPNITNDYMNKLGIKEGNLYYVSVDDEENFNLALELNMVDTSNLLIGRVKVGDYIKYTPGEGIYEATIDKTGYSEDQTFTSTAEEEIWRVLSVEGANVTIVRGEPTANLTLFGEAGYSNAQKVLNGIAGIYKNATQSQDARSIVIEDINKALNYTQTEMESYEGGSSTEGGYGYIGYEQNKSINYSYVGLIRIQDLDSTNPIYTMIFEGNNYKNYWVASNSIYARSVNAGFGVRAVENGEVKAIYIRNVSNEQDNEYDIESFYNLGTLPVVTLKSTATVLDGYGTQANPWKIN